MNKDEKKMIEEMEKIINENAWDGIKRTESYVCSEALYNANYRKIGEDEIVIKKSEYEKLTNDYLIMVNKGYYLGLAEGANEAEKKTAREILQEMKAKCKELENKYSHLCKSKKECLMETCRYEGVLAVKRELYDLAKKNGIELE